MKEACVRRRSLVPAASAVVALVAVLALLTPMGREVRGSVMERLGWWPTEEPAQAQERAPQDPAYYTDTDIEDAEVLTEDEIRQIAYDVCPQALDAGDCLDYTVEITNLDGAFGMVEVSWNRPPQGASGSGIPLETTGVMLDRSLVEQPTQYVANVAAHEWNHIEQMLRVNDLEGRNALKERAFDYYDARVPGGLPREGLGVEVLTDCMATEGDNVPAGVEDRTPPHYVKTYMGTDETTEACGDWRSVLHGAGA